LPKKVLIVDDHADTRIICHELLNHFGYTVIEASNGIEAVDLAFTHLPDLILLDFLMPESDGAETLKRLRSHNSLAQTAIVFFTAAATHATQLNSLQGIQGLILKPIEAEQLLGCVRGLIGEPEAERLP